METTTPAVAGIGSPQDCEGMDFDPIAGDRRTWYFILSMVLAIYRASILGRSSFRRVPRRSPACHVDLPESASGCKAIEFLLKIVRQVVTASCRVVGLGYSQGSTDVSFYCIAN